MSTQSAFQHGVAPLLKLLLTGKEAAVLSIQPDEALKQRIDLLASKSTEGELSDDERAEYEGYVRANKFAATLRRQARRMQSLAAS